MACLRIRGGAHPNARMKVAQASRSVRSALSISAIWTGGTADIFGAATETRRAPADHIRAAQFSSRTVVIGWSDPTSTGEIQRSSVRRRSGSDFGPNQ